MNWLRVLIHRIRGQFLKRRFERELHDEVRFHMEMQMQDNLNQGMSSEEARRAAMRKFGGADQMKESFRRRRGLPPLEVLIQDLKYAIRILRKNIGFTTIAILTLAIGIGANAAIFSLVNTVLLRPLPIENPQQVYSLNLINLKHRDQLAAFSYPKYKDIRDRNDVLTGVYAYRFAPISLSRNGNNERVWSYVVSGNYFDLLGVKPFIGRMFTQAEDQVPDANPVAVISYGCWQSRFGSDPSVVGKTVLFNGHPFNIVGVAPKGFIGTEIIFTPDIWVPFMMEDQVEPGNDNLNNRSNGGLFIGGRLKPGVTPNQAQSSLNILMDQVGKEYPDTDSGAGIELSPPGLVVPQMRNGVVAFAWVLMGTVVLVLLIAAVNLASLLLARATGRRREIAIRLSLGANRTRLIRQLLTESVLLSVIGGICGIFLALFLTRLISATRLPIEFPLTIDIKLDWRVVIFALVLSFVTGVVFGLAPALQATKTNLVSALKDDSSASGYRRSIGRSILVVAQISLSLVLLIISGLIVRSLQHVQMIGPGFNPEHALTMSVDLGLQGYSDEKGKQFYHQLLERVQVLPGVKSATISNLLPLGLNNNSNWVFIEGQPVTRGADTPEADRANVALKYFETMEIPIVAGRDFTAQDKEGSPPVAIVNETFARRFWPGQSALGKRLRLGSPTGRLIEVVGIAKDGKYWSLGEAPQLFVYAPLEQRYDSTGSLIVRTNAEPQAMIGAIRHEVQQLDPNLPVFDVKTLTEHMGLTLFPMRIGAWIVGSFGVLALTLAAIGIYGVMAYSVSQRRREVGIRMALGAGRGKILLMVIKQGFLLASIGLVSGLIISLVGAVLVGPFLGAVLYGVSATDLATFVGVTFILSFVTVVACLVPARKATRVDPMVALRYE
ncbi:MAG TPA: ABC transporter permease [Blastocatellia bacterium]|nr:ABC transporter permease [Blastocatellia bacterium]